MISKVIHYKTVNISLEILKLAENLKNKSSVTLF